MTKDIEQAKREFAEKWCPWSETTKFTTKAGEHAPFQNMLSDLTTLLEQHKEVMMGFIRWLFWCDYRMTEEGLHSTYESTPNGTLIELYEWWLKNVKN